MANIDTTAVRRALEALPTRCRYHGDNTAPDRPGWGREACCDTGAPAQRRKLAEAALDQLVNELAIQQSITADLRVESEARGQKLAAAETCWASLTGAGFFGTQQLGPCVLRADHDGPVHQAASGAKWWPTDSTPITDTQQKWPHSKAWQRLLDALTRPRICPCGAQQFAGRIIHNTDCWWPREPDPTPLRELAEQAVLGARACGGIRTSHAPDCPVHPARLRWAAEQATAQLPQELREAGLHFEFGTTAEDR